MAQIRPEDILKEAAASLKKTRAAMSLRAVAVRLGISPSYWSKILNGEKPLPQRLLPTVVKVLAMDTQQVARLQRSILETIESEQLAPATGMRTTHAAKESPVADYRNLGREDFWIIEEWFYFAILNLFTVTDFGGSTQEITERLGLRADQAESAVQRLETHGFLLANSLGGYELTDRQVRFPTDRSYAQVRKYHQQLLKKAHEELSRQDSADSFENRLISAINFAGSSEKLKEARLIIEEAMYKAANLMAGEETSDEVYQLNVQILPLTKSRK